ncbi:MAG: hypothetical protein L0177_18590, partial [Chloroflexi bacterium]|nr:hypothetical protein [Chloroflexota bacterium]
LEGKSVVALGNHTRGVPDFPFILGVSPEPSHEFGPSFGASTVLHPFIFLKPRDPPPNSPRRAEQGEGS